jgi:endonuclease III
MSSSIDERKDRAKKILAILNKRFPDAKPLLDYGNPFELLIATILAAQCTDERVNKVTPSLFKRYPDPGKLGLARIEDLEEIVRSTGFFHAKAKSIKRASEVLAEKYKGILPQSIDELAELPGVGRKTANVVAGNCFGAPAVIVDTHFKRVMGRLGLSSSEDPEKIEKDIREIVLEKNQTRFSLVVNFHGRYTCKAKKPLCPQCEIVDLCPYPDKTKQAVNQSA